MMKLELSSKYASEWGLSDLYEGAARILHAALASGEDFDTGWWICEKECRSARYLKTKGTVFVCVCCDMDRVVDGDLVDDMVAFSGREISDYQMDRILEWATLEVLDTVTNLEFVDVADATYDKLMSITIELEEKGKKQLDESVQKLSRFIEEVLGEE